MATDNLEFDFESEYSSDEGIEESTDALMAAITGRIEQDESRASVTNQDRVQQVLYTYKVMKRLMKGTGTKVTYELHEPYRSVGSVSVTGKNIDFRKMSQFLEAAEIASNFEVYPKTDGTVCLAFAFHNLTTPVE